MGMVLKNVLHITKNAETIKINYDSLCMAIVSQSKGVQDCLNLAGYEKNVLVAGRPGT